MFNTRKLSKVGCFTSGIILCSAFASPGFAAEKEIRVICNNWSGFAPVFVASDLGYFKAHGLNVKVKFDDSQSDAMAAITSGDVEVDMRTIDDYQRRPRTASTPGVIIGTIDESTGGDGVVADNTVNSISDLKGKTVAIENDIPAYLLLEMALKKAGLNYSDLKIKQTSGSDALSVFSDPNVAAIGTFQPFMNKAVELQKKRGAHVIVSSAAYPGTIVDVIIVNQKRLKADPAAYHDFLAGVYKAVEFYKTDPEKFIHLSAPHFGLSDKDFAESIKGSLSYSDLANVKKYFGSEQSPGSIYTVFDTLMGLNMENKASDNVLSAKQSIDSSVVNSISLSDIR
ncbi:NitT/TauT family transport system substrate-binding protein [Paramixta manurensis]|uniref:NitT/TauT family transport system substrate-binding protein n=1 Tax=Paramixta manurensis TaxID=2740817 RepID=A0A6M8UFP1_9GAMM|nr:NitT/TauT family transport system substrate-binding protein [Erwiniaceae bacterium PD-1]